MAETYNPKNDIIKPKIPQPVFRKIHTGPPLGTSELHKQMENTNICEKLSKQIKPIYGTNIRFRNEYDTEFTSEKHHMVRNKMIEYLENVELPESRLVEIKINDSYPNEPNKPRVKCIKIVPGDNGRSAPPKQQLNKRQSSQDNVIFS